MGKNKKNSRGNGRLVINGSIRGDFVNIGDYHASGRVGKKRDPPKPPRKSKKEKKSGTQKRDPRPFAVFGDSCAVYRRFKIALDKLKTDDIRWVLENVDFYGMSGAKFDGLFGLLEKNSAFIKNKRALAILPALNPIADRGDSVFPPLEPGRAAEKFESLVSIAKQLCSQTFSFEPFDRTSGVSSDAVEAYRSAIKEKLPSSLGWPECKMGDDGVHPDVGSYARLCTLLRAKFSGVAEEMDT